MGSLQIFNNPQFGQIRVVDVNAIPYFIANDICSALGYINPRKAVSDHCDIEDVTKCDTLTSGGIQTMTAINESGVYSLVFGSKLPSAKVFKRWVTSEVLPSVRKHGAYLTDQKVEEALSDPDTLIKLATQLKEERAERKRIAEQNELHKQQLQESAPKVQYYNEVLMSESTYNTNQIAKERGMSATTLNRKLRELGVQYKQGDQWLLYHKYQNKGFTKTHTHTFTKSDGTSGSSMQTVWTEKGREFVHNLLKN